MLFLSESTLKYRVVGALIVIVSLLIAWLLLVRFDQKRIEAEISQPLPKPINIETFSVPASFDQKNEQNLKQSIESDGVDSDNTEQPMPTDQQIAQEKYPFSSGFDHQGLPIAFVIQVASFKDIDNAKKLKTQLIKDNYSAYIKRSSVKDDNNYRVFVGPKLNRARANKLSKTLSKQYKLQTLVVQFKPGYVE